MQNSFSDASGSRSGVQELRLSDVYLGTAVQLQRLALVGERRRPPLSRLAQLRRLSLHSSQRASYDCRARVDVLQQLAGLAPHMLQLTALTLSGSETLKATRAAELAASLCLLPSLQDLEVHIRIMPLKRAEE